MELFDSGDLCEQLKSQETPCLSGQRNQERGYLLPQEWANEGYSIQERAGEKDPLILRMNPHESCTHL